MPLSRYFGAPKIELDKNQLDALFNHEAVTPMFYKGLIGNWCNNKEEAFFISLLELKNSLEQSRQKIQAMTERFQEKASYEDEDALQFSEDTVDELD